MLIHRFSTVLETKVLFIPYTAMLETKVLGFMSLDWEYLHNTQTIEFLRNGPI